MALALRRQTAVKPCEEIVGRYLRHCGYTRIVYEPKGRNASPDFEVNGYIAIEVRRLNQNYEGPTGIVGLESADMPLRQIIGDIASSLGPPLRGESWYIHYDFRRPIEIDKRLKDQLECELRTFRDSADHQPKQLKVGDAIRLEIERAGTTYPTFFVLGGLNDADAGGWTEAEVIRNAKIFINQKTANLSKYKSAYPEWWLVLVDRIGFGLGMADWEYISRSVPCGSDWDKIIVVASWDHTRAFELGPVRA